MSDLTPEQKKAIAEHGADFARKYLEIKMRPSVLWRRITGGASAAASQALPDGGAPQAIQSRACSYPSCLELNATECECCGKERFCEDHGSRGGDRQVQDVGAVYQPSQCWKCGVFEKKGAQEIDRWDIT